MRGALGLLLLAPWLALGAARADEPPEEAAVGAALPAEADETAAEGTAYDDYDDLYFDDDLEEEDDNDPLETMNRGVFWVNEGLNRYAIEPVSTGWDYVMPDFVQRALRNAFDNLRFPIIFFNDLFQLKPVYAGEDLARFALNSTVGIAGFMDPASAVGLPKRLEDFGQTLGFWGVPPGPYLMLPFFGPSNIRDGFGLLVDTAFRAVGFFIPFYASAAMQAVDTLNRHSLIREAIQAERRAALDWYAAVRSAYTQHRENLVRDRRAGADTGYDFYPSLEGDDAKE